jgi:predicted molibdopterin-dependent oxidoreductase YjgC
MRTSPITLTIDDRRVEVPAGSTILEACRSIGKEQPTLCYLDTLTPANACRVCVVELDGARLLAPSCSRAVEPGMVVRTDSERVRHSRKMVLEFLASSVDLTLTADIKEWAAEYECDASRYGPPAVPAADHERRRAGHHNAPNGTTAETLNQPIKVDNPLYIRDFSRCILCYRCVQACGIEAQNTFAIAVAGRGFDARISTEFDTPLTHSACVFCGNCIGVCPTGALMFRSEHELRRANLWEPERQTVTRTVCSYCGVGCNLELHVQDDRIVKVTSPNDHAVTSGHLCIKGRFGYEYLHELGDPATTPIDEVLGRSRSQT